MPDAPKQSADYLIKEKDAATGKYKIVGRGWKKQGQYGPFVSLSIGEPTNRKSYLLVDAPKQDAPPQEGPQHQPPPLPKKIEVKEIEDDSIPF